MRREYKYKIASIWSRIAVLKRYHGRSGEQVLRWLIESGREGGSEMER